jgi:voltage-gated potassium channel Kch
LNICRGTVAHARAADATVVFDTDDEVRPTLADAIRETDRSLDQITIIEWRAHRS